MCTATFIPRGSGYRLTMNRDEQRTRPRGVFPGPCQAGPLSRLGPEEPTGGSWIQVNSAGDAFALLNWYSMENRRQYLERPITRGTVIPAVSNGDRSEAVEAGILKLPLGRLRPFCLLAVFSAGRTLRQWRWDGERLRSHAVAWRPGIWISSSVNEPVVRVNRERIFQDFLAEPGVGERKWIEALHASHLPDQGAQSICMHREDAATVSCTAIEVNRTVVRVRYRDGAPCSSARWRQAETARRDTGTPPE